MMKHLNHFFVFVILALGSVSLAEEHKHDSKEKSKHPQQNEDKVESQDEHADPHGDEHGHEGGEHEEEGTSSVGPDKGITEASEENGIKLSPEALKNFEIKTQTLSGNGPWTVPASSRLHALEESNLYRRRGGYFKRIDFVLLKSNESQITVSSKELNAGDEVVTGGIGFLRIAELTAFGGAPEGHSH